MNILFWKKKISHPFYLIFTYVPPLLIWGRITVQKSVLNLVITVWGKVPKGPHHFPIYLRGCVYVFVFNTLSLAKEKQVPLCWEKHCVPFQMDFTNAWEGLEFR